MWQINFKYININIYIISNMKYLVTEIKNYDASQTGKMLAMQA